MMLPGSAITEETNIQTRRLNHHRVFVYAGVFRQVGTLLLESHHQNQLQLFCLNHPMVSPHRSVGTQRKQDDVHIGL